MANYVAVGRSSYFRVHDPEKFKKIIDEFDQLGYRITLYPIKGGKYSFRQNLNEPCFVAGPITYHHSNVDRNLLREVSQLLQEGETIIYCQLGREGLKYFSFDVWVVRPNKIEHIISGCDTNYNLAAVDPIICGLEAIEDHTSSIPTHRPADEQDQDEGHSNNDDSDELPF